MRASGNRVAQRTIAAGIPTVALMNKYKEHLRAYAEWKEEINLGMCLFVITRAKIELLKIENQKRIEAEPENPAIKFVPPPVPRIVEVPQPGEFATAVAQ